MRIRPFVIAAAITFVVAVVSLFPARVAYHWFAPDTVAVSGIDGSVWNGSARALSANGFYLGDLKWSFKPLSLFTGKLGYAVEASPVSGFFEGDVAIGFGGSLTASNLSGLLPLAPLGPLVNQPGLGGTASVKLEQLVVSGGVPVEILGTLEVRDLLFRAIDTSSIGGYRAEFSTVEGEIIASVEDTDGILDVAATLRLSEDGTYQFLGKVGEKPETPDKIRRQLVVLGSPDNRGQREVRLEGSL